MSLEAITAVEKAEADAAQTRTDALAEAKRIRAEARTAGREAIETARRKAEDELKVLSDQASDRYASEAAVFRSSTDDKKAEMKARAEERLESAAEKIAERIVKS